MLDSLSPQGEVACITSNYQSRARSVLEATYNRSTAGTQSAFTSKILIGVSRWKTAMRRNRAPLIGRPRDGRIDFVEPKAGLDVRFTLPVVLRSI
jgi:hypothetical protein